MSGLSAELTTVTGCVRAAGRAARRPSTLNPHVRGFKSLAADKAWRLGRTRVLNTDTFPTAAAIATVLIDTPL
jgi:hypothetical protein